MADSRDLSIVRQNQSGQARELLKAKGWLPYLNTFEFMVYVQLWTDFCLQGTTEDIKKRFKAFDEIIEGRIRKVAIEEDGILL
jgi:hypothetical protein